jgi:hypothetical protein
MVIASKNEYEVEEILDSQMRYNHLEYLIKWKGYNMSNNGRYINRSMLSQRLPCSIATTPALLDISRQPFLTQSDSIPFTRADLATSWRSLHIMTLHL